MLRVEDILNWNFRPTHLRYGAKHLLKDSVKKQIKSSTNSLELIIDRMPDGSNMPNRASIEDVYFLFLNNYQTLFSTMSKREIRHLIWALDYQPTSNDTKILLSNILIPALNLIKQNWRDSFIISLWHVLLKNWTDLQLYEKNRNFFFNFLKEKCKSYEGKRSAVLSITQNIDFFLTKDSPYNYAALLLDRKIVLSNANKLFKQKERIINYDYYSAVAHEYIYIIWSMNKHITYSYVNGVYQFLKDHNSKKTSLIVCAQLINEKVFDKHIEVVKSETINLIGDPANKSRWRNINLNESEQNEVERARKKLNILLNKEFVEVFFKKLMEDERREKYWLKFIEEINDLKVVGNEANKLYLAKTDDISKYVEDRYIQTPSIRSTCALIMHAKDFVFVEFTDTGPLLIYKKETFDSRINLEKIESVDDLKKWSTGDYACRNSATHGYVDLDVEGRITHQGRWEGRVNVWMRQYYYD